MKKNKLLYLPKAKGLYNPANETESCGVGFIANLKSCSSHKIVHDALKMLGRMDHRGGCGCEENTGDGAGILTNLPYDFFYKEIKKLFNIKVVQYKFAVGNIFLPQDESQAQHCQSILENTIVKKGLKFIGWRETPIDNKKADIGKTAFDSQPIIKQVIIVAQDNTTNEEFERSLFVVRKRVSKIIRTDNRLSQALLFYISSLSSKTIVYKGMLIGSQVLDFYKDLSNPAYSAYLAMVHSRFSTNTFPSWDRAQPCRYICHNGEINTSRGNINWITAREGNLESALFSDADFSKSLPVIETEVSDSGALDNVLELLIINGRSLPEAMAMMIPEAWQNDEQMDDDKKAFYEYNAHLMEPWDGPASVTVTDGNYIGAALDRNGLRPSRYYITTDDRVIMASEVGVVDIDNNKIKKKGRLRPGKMFLVDFKQAKLISDTEIKNNFAKQKPYRAWINEQQIHIEDISNNEKSHSFYPNTLIERMNAFGYTTETMQFMLIPLVKDLRDPLGSMGNDAALACLSDKSRIIYDYFKQLFAQVTNPAIDSIREEIVMSLKCAIGPEGNLLDSKPENAHRMILEQPILTNEELYTLKYCRHRGWKTKLIDITYDKNNNNKLEKLLTDICYKSSKAIADGYSLIILSDRNISKNRNAISMLLASSAVHRYLVKRHERTKIGIILESGEPREVHHFCLLIGFGADAINPYLAFESLWQARIDKLINIDDDDIVLHYRKGIAKGMLKVMAKMGISTLQSYKGAQIFEAVGLSEEVIDRCFYGVPSRISGISFDVLQQESEHNHNKAYNNNQTSLGNDGMFHWRSKGEIHMWNPQTIQLLQQASRNNDINTYKKFANNANKQSIKNCTLRGLMKFTSQQPIDISKVEPASEIVKRFATGAMSFGSISAESHESLAIAMNRIGAKSNSGEGGEDSARWQIIDGDSKRSAIKQVASARFGVTIEYLNNADEIQIKVSQGAKPGEGGELPGKKVDDKIASIRHSTPGVGLISPPPHHDIYSIEDLSQLIFDLKHANHRARISVKLVSESGVGTVAAGVVKAKSDHIVIAGHDGGTGASPLTSIKHAGMPWEIGVAETHQTLVMNDLRSRVVIQTDGQMKTGRDVAIAILLGAEEFGFSTAPLITMGCIMMRKCHLNTCPVGIATQDKELRKKFTGKPEYVINYLFMIAEELREIMAEIGFSTINEMIGRTDKLDKRGVFNHYKKYTIDLSAILAMAEKPHSDTVVYNNMKQNHNIEEHIDNKFISLTKDALSNKQKIMLKHKVTNKDRALGSMLSSKLIEIYGNNKLDDGTIHIKLTGSAGQTLGGFLAKGITLELEGDANDYVAKGLSGGKVIIYPPKNSLFNAEEEIIAGNVCAYGATSGELYICGVVAERFCVRNSGAYAVVEGIGDHGCEYMTGGRVAILGDIGRNFGAGMSGGIAYIYDANNTVKDNCNIDMIDLDIMDEDSIIELKNMLEKHADYTKSKLASKILANFYENIEKFIKIIPKEYKKILKKSKKHRHIS